MYATKQTARKSTGGRVGPYTLAGDRVEDEGDEIGDTGEDEEYEDGVCATLLLQAYVCLLPTKLFLSAPPYNLQRHFTLYLVYCCYCMHLQCLRHSVMRTPCKVPCL